MDRLRQEKWNDDALKVKLNNSAGDYKVDNVLKAVACSPFLLFVCIACFERRPLQDSTFLFSSLGVAKSQKEDEGAKKKSRKAPKDSTWLQGNMGAVKTHKASGGCCDKNCRDVADAYYVSFTTDYGLDGPVVTDTPTIYYTKEKSKKGRLYLPDHITFNGLTIVKNDSCEPPVDPPSPTSTRCFYLRSRLSRS